MIFNAPYLKNEHCPPPPPFFLQISAFLLGKFQNNLNMGTICPRTSLRPIYLGFNMKLTFSFFRR